jgi:hypothetical protein
LAWLLSGQVTLDLCLLAGECHPRLGQKKCHPRLRQCQDLLYICNAGDLLLVAFASSKLPRVKHAQVPAQLVLHAQQSREATAGTALHCIKLMVPAVMMMMPARQCLKTIRSSTA